MSSYFLGFIFNNANNINQHTYLAQARACAAWSGDNARLWISLFWIDEDDLCCWRIIHKSEWPHLECIYRRTEWNKSMYKINKIICRNDHSSSSRHRHLIDGKKKNIAEQYIICAPFSSSNVFLSLYMYTSSIQ